MPPETSSHASWQEDFRQGALTMAPVGVTVLIYALAFGALSAAEGLSWLEVLVMSGLVNAGSAQFVALDLWAEPAAGLLIVASTLLINLRHVLMGATFRPYLAHLPAAQAYPLLFFLADENWALAIARAQKAKLTPAYFLGLSLALYPCWMLGGLLGNLTGSLIEDPSALGLDFAFTAVFLVLLMGLRRGRGDLLPWGASAAAALLAYLTLPGVWYIIIGAGVGTLVGALAWRKAA